MCAQTFTASDAPSNGQWAANTHWYTIKFKEKRDATTYRYWGNEGDFLDSDGNLKSIDASGMTAAEGMLWCVVGDETNGYQFYNYAAGATKVLGLTIDSSNDGNDRLKFYDASSVSSSVTTKFIRGTSTGDFGSAAGSGNAFKAAGTDNRYINSRQPYLASWNNAAALTGGTSGSAFIFEEVVLPAADTRYTIQNKANSQYLSMPITYGADLCAASSVGRNACWVAESGASDRTYRFRNAGTGYYMGTADFDASVTPSDYSFFLNLSSGALALGDGNSKYLSLSSDACVGDATASNATSLALATITDEAYAALAAIPENIQSIGLKAQLIASKLPVTSEAYTAAKTAYEASKTLDNAKAFLNAAELCKYVRIKSYLAQDQALSIRTKSDGTYEAHGSAWNNSDASLIWKLEFVDEDNFDLRLKLHNLNTDKYLGALAWGTAQTTSMVELSDTATFAFYADEGTFHFYQLGKNNKEHQINYEGNTSSVGNINDWKEGNGVKWYVFVATDIELPLTAIGDHAYATTCLPFPVSAVSEGVKVYKGQLNTDKTWIGLSELTDGIAKGEGVVLIADDKSTTTATLTIGGSTEKASDNVFGGTTTAIALTDANRGNYRVMGRKAGSETNIGFFKPSSSVSAITANRAYIDATGIAAQTLSVGFGTIDGIGEAIAADSTTDGNAAVYDLSGRRVTGQLKSGIYIRGGKKVLVK